MIRILGLSAACAVENIDKASSVMHAVVILEKVEFIIVLRAGEAWALFKQTELLTITKRAK